MLQVSGELCAAACRRKPQARHSRRGTVRVPETIPNSAAWHSGALRGLCEGASRCLDFLSFDCYTDFLDYYNLMLL